MFFIQILQLAFPSLQEKFKELIKSEIHSQANKWLCLASFTVIDLLFLGRDHK
jgi:hypothetical protein